MGEWYGSGFGATRGALQMTCTYAGEEEGEGAVLEEVAEPDGDEGARSHKGKRRCQPLVYYGHDSVRDAHHRRCLRQRRRARRTRRAAAGVGVAGGTETAGLTWRTARWPMARMERW